MAYECRILTLAAALHAAAELRPGTVRLMTVEHDVDCLLMRGGLRCDCEPDMVKAGPPISAQERPVRDS
jgi:hypothetical protein